MPDFENDSVMDPAGLDSKGPDVIPEKPANEADEFGFADGAANAKVTSKSTSIVGGTGVGLPDGSEPERDAALVGRAKSEFGFTDDDLANLSDSQLSRMIDRWDRQQALMRQQQQYQQPQPQQYQQQPQRPPIPMPGQFQNPFAGAEDIDPRIAKAFDDLNRYHNHNLAYALQGMNNMYSQLQSSYSQLQAERQNERLEATWNKADSAIDALDEQYEQFVGKGGGKGEARDPYFESVRQSLTQTAAGMAMAAGENPMTMNSSAWSKYVKKAANAEFGDQLEARARQNVTRKIRENQSTIMPRQNNALSETAAKGRKAALDYVGQFDR